MSISARHEQFISLWAAFKAQNPLQVLGPPMSFSDFDGPTLSEAQSELRFVVETFDSMLATDSLKELSWNAMNTLQSLLQNVHNAFTPLASTRDQGSYQNFAQHLDSLAYHTRLMGLPYLAMGGSQLERARAQAAMELDRLVSTRGEVEQLRDNVRTLITPAVAGSLSQAFTTRRDALLVGRIVWGVGALLLGGFAVFATFSFANVVGEAMKVALTASASTSHDIVWAGAIIRSMVLIPLFAAFGFAFAQYKKERDFEEEYAHKAAVAASLPNYGELARDASVRDQIVTGATGVIFSSPTAQYRAGQKPERSLKDVTALMEAASKLAGNKP
jgi:hypothetical protein